MRIANEASVGVTLDSNNIDVKAANILKNLRSIQGLAKLSKRKSIMTMASPGFYTYPMIASGAIETEYLLALARGFQQTFASSVVVAYSLNPNANRGDYPQLADVAKKFHQNDPSLLGGNLNGAAKALGIDASESLTEITVESAMTIPISDEDAYLLNSIAWERTTDGLVLESLNDMYTPYTRTERILTEKIDMINQSKEASKATEGIGDLFDKIGGISKNINYSVNGTPKSKNATGLNAKVTKTTYKTDRNGNEYTESRVVEERPSPVPNFKNEVVRNNQLEAMEPTMVNVQVTMFGREDAKGSSGQSVHNLTLAVKVMPRLVGSELMIASLVEACQNAKAIFKFLKWTNGELKTVDRIFGWSAAKSKAMKKSAKAQVKFLEQSAKRKKENLLGRFLHNEVLPTMTLVITAYEAMKVKEICGVDLQDLQEAIRFMNKYYLLAFGIYDTEQNTIKVMFDCDTDWGYTTISALKGNTNKNTDLMNMNAIMRLFGRSGM